MGKFLVIKDADFSNVSVGKVSSIMEYKVVNGCFMGMSDLGEEQYPVLEQRNGFSIIYYEIGEDVNTINASGPGGTLGVWEIFSCDEIGDDSATTPTNIFCVYTKYNDVPRPAYEDSWSIQNKEFSKKRYIGISVKTEYKSEVSIEKNS